MENDIILTVMIHVDDGTGKIFKLMCTKRNETKQNKNQFYITIKHDPIHMHTAQIANIHIFLLLCASFDLVWFGLALVRFGFVGCLHILMYEW